MRRLVIYLAVLILFCAGCSYSKGQWSWNFEPFNDLIFPMIFGPEEDEFDRMWKAGYGFNNPNASKRPPSPKDN